MLEKGEGVFTPGQMRAMGGPNVEINIIDQRSGGDDIQTRKRTGSDGRTIFDIIVGEIQKDQDRNGPITRGFANTFGLSRQPSAGR